jgi:CRP/FNR family transcriptional regulator, cyclic AMP receptor protein
MVCLTGIRRCAVRDRRGKDGRREVRLTSARHPPVPADAACRTPPWHSPDQRPRLAERLLALRPADAASLELARHDVIYHSGSLDRHVYLVEQGQVKTQVVAANGKRCLLSVYVEGDIFGETATLAEARREAAVALAPTVVRRLPEAGFRAMLAAHGLGEAYQAYLCWRLLDQQKVIASMVTMSSELRLAVRILDLAVQLGRPGAAGVVDAAAVVVAVRFTQEDLAEMVGTTRTRVGQFLKRFRQRGLVHLVPRSHLIVHRPRLTEWIEQTAR